LINTLKAQTGHAAELYLNIYLMVRDKSEFKPQKKEYVEKIFNYEDELISRDNTTIVVPKPEAGEFSSDLYVRRFVPEERTSRYFRLRFAKAGTKKKPTTASKSETATAKASKKVIPSSTSRKKWECTTTGTDKKCTLDNKVSTASKVNVSTTPSTSSSKEAVFVRHYFHDGNKESKRARRSSTYTIDPATGKPLRTTKFDFGALWVPRDAFGVYLVDKAGKVGKENLLIEQDILVGKDGGLVLRTKKLGDKPTGKYRVKVVAKYMKPKPEVKPVDSLDQVTSYKQIKLFMNIGMAMGSLEHIYSGKDPMWRNAPTPSCTTSSCSTPEPTNPLAKMLRKDVSLLLSNYHVFDNTLEKGYIREIRKGHGKKGKLRGMYLTLATLPMTKFDERKDGTWLRTGVYGNMHKKNLDAVVMQLVNSWKKGSVPTVKWAKCDPQIGDRAIVVGHPLGLIDEQVKDNASISDPDHDAGKGWLDMISFYGNLIGGNSGGGLYNMKGEMLGVNSGSYIKVSMKKESDIPGIDITKVVGLKDVFKRDEKDKGKPLFTEANRKELAKKIFKALEGTLEGQKMKDMLKEELAHKMTDIYTSEVGKPTGRVAIVPTGLDLARKGTRIQEWMKEKGLDIGQPRKFSFSGNNDRLNKCKK
jgi:hypothetical protein